MTCRRLASAVNSSRASSTRARRERGWRAGLEQALGRTEELLRGSAIELLRRRAVRRETGVELLATTFLAGRHEPRVHVDLGLELTDPRTFVASAGDDPANARIVAALATALLRDAMPFPAPLWSMRLRACRRETSAGAALIRS